MPYLESPIEGNPDHQPMFEAGEMSFAKKVVLGVAAVGAMVGIAYLQSRGLFPIEP